jgi:hypothetical protein
MALTTQAMESKTTFGTASSFDACREEVISLTPENVVDAFKRIHSFMHEPQRHLLKNAYRVEIDMKTGYTAPIQRPRLLRANHRHPSAYSTLRIHLWRV